MKSKYWIMILAAIFILCLVSVLPLFFAEPAAMAQIKYSSSVMTVRLKEDQELTFTSDNGGYNTVTVKDGKIAVTEADCPDQYCVQRGFCGSGTPIVCLPHSLVIEFLGEQEIDGLLG